MLLQNSHTLPAGGGCQAVRQSCLVLAVNGVTETAVQVVLVTRQHTSARACLGAAYQILMLGRQDARDSFGQVLNRC